MRPTYLVRVFAAIATVLVGLTGCGVFAVKEQQAQLDAFCRIGGKVEAERKDVSVPLVVILARQTGADPTKRESWQVADHFVLEAAGPWAFAAPPGEYRLAAFEDANRDLKYQPGESFLGVEATAPIQCAAGTRARDISLRIPAGSAGAPAAEVDVVTLQARDVHGQMRRTLGQLTADDVRAACKRHLRPQDAVTVAVTTAEQAQAALGAAGAGPMTIVDHDEY